MNNTQLFQDFLLEKSLSSAPRTLDYYRENLTKFNNYVDSALLGKPYKDITKQDYSKYLLHLKKTGIKNTSLATYHRAVRTFCNWMLDNNYIDAAFTKVKLPRPDPEVILPLSSQEVEQVDNYIKTTMYPLRNYLIFHLMLDCGLRRQEIINLSWQDLHLPEGYIVIRCSKYNKNRLVPLPGFLAKYLSLLSKSCSYVLTSSGGQLTESAVKNFFRRLRKRTVQRLHPHLLRHTFATSYICGGGNMEFLRLYLGHADYAITKNYLHISYQMQITGYQMYPLDKIFFRNFYSGEEKTI